MTQLFRVLFFSTTVCEMTFVCQHGPNHRDISCWVSINLCFTVSLSNNRNYSRPASTSSKFVSDCWHFTDLTTSRLIYGNFQFPVWVNGIFFLSYYTTTQAKLTVRVKWCVPRPQWGVIVNLIMGWTRDEKGRGQLFCNGALHKQNGRHPVCFIPGSALRIIKDLLLRWKCSDLFESSFDLNALARNDEWIVNGKGWSRFFYRGVAIFLCHLQWGVGMGNLLMLIFVGKDNWQGFFKYWESKIIFCGLFCVWNLYGIY